MKAARRLSCPCVFGMGRRQEKGIRAGEESVDRKDVTDVPCLSYFKSYSGMRRGILCIRQGEKEKEDLWR